MILVCNFGFEVEHDGDAVVANGDGDGDLWPPFFEVVGNACDNDVVARLVVIVPDLVVVLVVVTNGDASGDIRWTLICDDREFVREMCRKCAMFAGTLRVVVVMRLLRPIGKNQVNFFIFESSKLTWK